MSMLTNLYKSHKILLLFFLLSSLFYILFAYRLLRTDTTTLSFLYVALFLFAYQIIKITGFYRSTKRTTGFKLLVISALLFRILFLFAIPNLSQDFYRFIWDGRMILEGFNPYLYTPDSFITNDIFPIGQAQELHRGMTSLSTSNFTNYPPLSQLCFAIAALFSGKSILGSVLVLRAIIIAADIGTLYFGKKLLDRLKMPSNRIFWYILNPFIIIELTGNIHFEGVMIFFLIWSLYLLHSGNWKWAAVIFACSVSVKLIPLMFLPLFFKWFTSTALIERKKKKTDTILKHNQDDKENLVLSANAIYNTNKLHTNKTPNVLKTFQATYLKLVTFYVIIGVITLLLFLPFFSVDFITNYSQTVGLWFGKFEFNASIYYVLRHIGFTLTGYNEIAIIGKVLPIATVLIILGFSFFREQTNIPKLIVSIMLVFTCYLFLSTTVHPWYIATLVSLCVFTNYKFPLIWSLVIVMSYFAYSNTSDSENLWIVGLEYLIVFSVFIWDVSIVRSKSHK
jgi:alpha-1,6-mannosyltransferase